MMIINKSEILFSKGSVKILFPINQELKCTKNIKSINQEIELCGY